MMQFLGKMMRISFVVATFQISFVDYSFCMILEEEESNLTISSARKFIEEVIFPFNCCLNRHKDKPHNKLSHSKRDQTLAHKEDSSIVNLPREIIYIIAHYLNPLDIVRISNTCNKFSFLKNEDFWNYYNNFYNYYDWDESIPLINITFANYWYKKGRIKKAADMGFPKAIEKINLMESNKNYLLQNPVSSAHSNYHTYRSGFNNNLPRLILNAFCPGVGILNPNLPLFR